MERKLVKTADGSTTIFLPEWNEHYHSKHGAIQEAYHVFIKSGLEKLAETRQGKISILEIGFGTGLNAFISLLEAENQQLELEYTGVEAYPVSKEEVERLNYSTAFKQENAQEYFMTIHRAPWEEPTEITPFFSLWKQQRFFANIIEVDKYDLIYFDAFGPRVQPELWTEHIFKKMYMALRNKGLLVTYSAKGSVRRAMQAVGFEVERLPGPPGKREMLRARKEPGQSLEHIKESPV